MSVEFCYLYKGYKWAFFPPHNGNSVPPYSGKLHPGARIDRFGGSYDEAGEFSDPRGNFFGEPGTSQLKRAMEPRTGPFSGSREKKILSEYELVRPIEVEIAPAAPWFEKASDGLESGGAIQYRFKDPDNPGKFLSADELLDRGFIEKITRELP